MSGTSLGCAESETQEGREGDDAMTDPIREVYEQYKHLDHLLSDDQWLIGEKDDDRASLTYRRMVYEMWGAIRAEIERMETP
jgi:hypothetical protein